MKYLDGPHPPWADITDGVRDVIEVHDCQGRKHFITVRTLLNLAEGADYSVFSDTPEQAREPLCSICRRHHGTEVQHVCE